MVTRSIYTSNQMFKRFAFNALGNPGTWETEEYFIERYVILFDSIISHFSC